MNPSWTDFRRQWKKDRRFYGWGRDDREREKRFREFLKELGESAICERATFLWANTCFSGKRAEAQKAEADFFTLLRESGVASKGEPWSAVSETLVLHAPNVDDGIRSKATSPRIRVTTRSGRPACARSCTTHSSKLVAKRPLDLRLTFSKRPSRVPRRAKTRYHGRLARSALLRSAKPR
jgi:hypothetical protein